MIVGLLLILDFSIWQKTSWISSQTIFIVKKLNKKLRFRNGERLKKPIIVTFKNHFTFNFASYYRYFSTVKKAELFLQNNDPYFICIYGNRTFSRNKFKQTTPVYTRLPSPLSFLYKIFARILLTAAQARSDFPVASIIFRFLFTSRLPCNVTYACSGILRGDKLIYLRNNSFLLRFACSVVCHI